MALAHEKLPIGRVPTFKTLWRRQIGRNILVLAAASLACSGQAATASGNVFAWGDNRYGQTAVPPDLSNIVSTAAGYWHTLVLTADGRVVAWGRNDQGQTDVPADLTNITAIAALEAGSMALRADGTVVVWGSNARGQANVPEDVTNIVAIAGGRNHCLALRANGTVRGWGDGQYNQLGITDAFNNNVIAIAAAADSSMILRSDGFLWVPGRFGDLERPPHDYYGVQKMGRVGQDLLILYTNNVLLRVNTHSEQTNITLGVSNIIQISGGPNHALVLGHAGKIATLGENVRGQCHVPEDLAGVLAVAAGAEHSVVIATQSVRPFIFSEPLSQRVLQGLRFMLRVGAGFEPLSYQWFKDGSPVAGGTNSALTIPAMQPSSVGLYYAIVTNMYGCATSRTARLTMRPTRVPATAFGWGSFGWGATDSSELGFRGLTNVLDIAGGYDGAVAVMGDGTLRTWARYFPTNAPSLTNAVAVSVGESHVAVLTQKGEVVCWGENRYRQCQVPAGLSNVVAVATGSTCTLALRNDGTVAYWGACGPDSVLTNLNNVVSLVVTFHHYLALRSDGTVVTWASNPYGTMFGQSAIPADLSNVVDIATTAGASVAVDDRGRVTAWANIPQPPTHLANVVDLAGGGGHALALRNDGHVFAWGLHNNEGQLNVPSWLRGVDSVHAGIFNSVVLTHFPVLLAEPQPVFATIGSNAMVRVQPGGEGPFTVKWRRDGMLLPARTNSAFTIAPVQMSDEAEYVAEITNPHGSIISPSVRLFLLPFVTEQPQSRIATIGRSVTLTCSVTGTPPFTYTWYRGTAAIRTSSTPALTLTNVQLNDAGAYSISIENVGGPLRATRSRSAMLSVVPALDVVRQANQLRFSWPPWPHALRVDWAPDLVQQSWRPIAVNMSSNWFMLPMTGTQGFYRVMPASSNSPPLSPVPAGSPHQKLRH